MADLLDRVQKLIALSASPAEEEARSAAYKACQLIREHGLVVRMVGVDPGRPRVDSRPVPNQPGQYKHTRTPPTSPDFASEFFRKIQEDFLRQEEFARRRVELVTCSRCNELYRPDRLHYCPRPEKPEPPQPEPCRLCGDPVPVGNPHLCRRVDKNWSESRPSFFTSCYFCHCESQPGDTFMRLGTRFVCKKCFKAGKR